MSATTLDSLIKLPVRLFKFLAIDFGARDSKAFTLRRIFAWINILNLTLYAVCCNNFFFLDEAIEMGKAVFGISIGATLLMLIVRYYLISMHQSDIRDIIERLNRIYAPKGDDIAWYSKTFARFSKTYSVIMCTSLVFFCFEPSSTLVASGKRIFPFNIVFPFDATEVNFYPLLMAWLFVCHLTYVVTSVCNEILLYGVITVLATEFKALRAEIERLEEVEGGDLLTKLKTVVERHEQLLDISSCIEKIFSPSFFCNYVLSSIVICFTAFQASITTNTFELVFCLMFSLVILSQISLQCIFGQSIKDCSQEILEAIYGCPWDGFPTVESRKILLFMLTRAQRPTILTALKFSEIDMVQFNTIIRRTYSYFTLCRSFLTK